jgi:hypothetical protein
MDNIAAEVTVFGASVICITETWLTVPHRLPSTTLMAPGLIAITGKTWLDMV